MQHIDQPALILDGRLIALLVRQDHRRVNKMDIVRFAPGILGTQAPPPILARLGWVGTLPTILIEVDWLQPWGRIMRARERHASSKMRFQMWPRDLPGLRFKQNRKA